MARIRTIKPEFFDDEEIAALSFPARLAFIGLWQQADREGRLKDRPVRLKARIFPFDDVSMPALLDELARRKFILRYQVNGDDLIVVRTFDKHQHLNGKEAPSTLPPPPTYDECKSGGGKTIPAPDEPSFFLQEGKGREGNGKEGKEDSAEPLRDSTPAAVLTFPVVGRGPETWALTATQIAEWQECYPGIDVAAECLKALAWLRANTGRRKTAKGMPRMLVDWFNRTTDRGSAGGSARVAPRSAASQPTFESWTCPHLDEHTNRWRCEQATALNRPRKVAS